MKPTVACGARSLQTRLVRVRPPGRTIVYSTYGMALAGELIEEVSGVVEGSSWSAPAREHTLARYRAVGCGECEST